MEIAKYCLNLFHFINKLNNNNLFIIGTIIMHLNVILFIII